MIIFYNSFFFFFFFFFNSAKTEWNELDCYISNADLFEVFEKCILSFIRPIPNSIYNIHNLLGVTYLTKLRIRFSHLKEHEFKQNFQDLIDLMCSCNSDIETAVHFFSIAQISILKDKPPLAK